MQSSIEINIYFKYTKSIKKIHKYIKTEEFIFFCRYFFKYLKKHRERERSKMVSTEENNIKCLMIGAKGIGKRKTAPHDVKLNHIQYLIT